VLRRNKKFLLLFLNILYRPNILFEGKTLVEIFYVIFPQMYTELVTEPSNRRIAKHVGNKLKTLDAQTHLHGNSEYVTLG
jgi:hypothetical protein